MYPQTLRDGEATETRRLTLMDQDKSCWGSGEGKEAFKMIFTWIGVGNRDRTNAIFYNSTNMN